MKDHHQLGKFDCGEPSLNVWLVEHARRAQIAGTSRTYVWTPEGADDVVAYYSIAPTQVERAGLTGGQAGGFTIVPAYLLARFALDRSLQGHHLSDDLLLDAIEVITKAATVAGGRLIVVDAINNPVATYYQRRGFQPVKGDPLRLVMKVETAKRALSTGLVTVSTQGGLAGLVLSTPRGEAASVVASPDELRAIARELENQADDAAAHPATVVSLREAIKTALGRDPFAAD
ncbi:hypothetical protein OHA72_06450 [Dactylosporangium sp. NBC_01737]|uniref:hypothetical protein n=1 Tax=Dactylosporangium sp. NBC_01737 TaxID=2975959 RepID=UPI002E11B41C|nr:hypothetical protein OHA72_06450 [Dactylosporangium sp. NBC_01737]